MTLIPASVATALLGGELAAEQLPDLETREALIREAVVLKAGPDGATLGNAVRAWGAYAVSPPTVAPALAPTFASTVLLVV